MSGNGRLLAVLQNTGAVTADFSLSATACSEGIEPIAEQTASVAAGASVPFTFALRTNRVGAARYQCTLTLRDSLAAVLQVRIVIFNVTALVEDRGAQGGQRIPGGAAEFGSDTNTCSIRCTSFFALSCFWAYSCWTELLRTVGMICGLALLLCCCHGNIRRLLSFVVEQVFASLSTNSNDHQKQETSRESRRGHRNHRLRRKHLVDASESEQNQSDSLHARSFKRQVRSHKHDDRHQNNRQKSRKSKCRRRDEKE
jgi:hypothetical protein